jgi:hypothetical protein
LSTQAGNFTSPPCQISFERCGNCLNRLSAIGSGIELDIDATVGGKFNSKREQVTRVRDQRERTDAN